MSVTSTTSTVRNFVNHLAELIGVSRDANVSRETVRLELARAGLLGRCWSLEHYRLAVERETGLAITVEDYPDLRPGLVTEKMLPEDVLAEVDVNEELTEAIVLVRQSLRRRGSIAYTLCVLHELSHLMAGHYLKSRKLRLQASTIRRAGRWQFGPSTDEAKMENEARRRAKLLLLAGTNPEFFELESSNKFT